MNRQNTHDKVMREYYHVNLFFLGGGVGLATYHNNSLSPNCKCRVIVSQKTMLMLYQVFFIGYLLRYGNTWIDPYIVTGGSRNVCSSDIFLHLMPLVLYLAPAKLLLYL
jgi:hypothetical protein